MQYRGSPHVLYVGRDISARKRAEEALRASEEQYRSIFNATSDALVLRDAEARVVDVNPAFLAMSGYSRDEVVNETRWFFADAEMSGLAKTDALARDRRRIGAFRGARRAQGRLAAGSGNARSADALPRPAARPRHGARHYRAQARRRRARAARGAAAAGAEDGGDRPPRRRHRARLQQHPHEHPGLRAARRRAAGGGGRRQALEPPRSPRARVQPRAS